MGARFEVNIIPYTHTRTTLGRLRLDESANLEVDLVARYLARLTRTESVSEDTQLSSVEDVLADARLGKMIILVDDEERENEGDLVIPAEKASAEAINFMAMHGRGLVCLALNGERATSSGCR